ncbi:CAP domain-containing protein [Pseudomonas sp. MH9.2]|uniref:CAP domain-containing protein n=1 Tax=unclassified Pseudomonas TaxID=196821 RepID=UPI002AC91D69|nr:MULTISPECIES: CAP domain-containing protein [unclassified Pseudomonas]MEB0006357.1 CAP domain-containing protein [Pseudomonas sp. RTB2]MEB0018597.1 CAP domain-containing protein [Pseudomonas sp. RTB3]MEB0024459.1 CAP domain-containing protein [Pseudomonas sp. MH9.2]MEB0150535.1 CAP domain-containing protein [Pseudomonas sp. CCC2.2]MEB0269260.1 CAP domain-containing protein [Pseudomonas sp. 5B4]
MRLTVRSSRSISLCLVPLLPLLANPAYAEGEQQLVQAINGYRAHPQRCEGRMTPAMTPLALKSSVALPVGYGGDLRDGLKAAGYQAGKVQAIQVAGARDAETAFAVIKNNYCDKLLNTQATDIGVTHVGNRWQMVLARPLVDDHLTDRRTADKALLTEVNAARAKPRLCGYQRFAAARPLTWNNALGAAAQGHSRAMAYGNYFAHQDPNGDSPAARARAVGYRGRQIGENIAAGQGSPSQAMQGWLASPGHCANLMNPMFTQVGAAYATASRSDLGIYWTMLFGAP